MNGASTRVTISARKVKNIMLLDFATISSEQLVGDDPAIMARRKMGALPVLKKEKSVEISTANDILGVFVKSQNDIDDFRK